MGISASSSKQVKLHVVRGPSFHRGVDVLKTYKLQASEVAGVSVGPSFHRGVDVLKTYYGLEMVVRCGRR